MVLPLNNNTDPYHSFTYYQAIITSELIATLSIFIILQSIHYFIWGHDQEIWEWKKREEGEAGLQKLPQSSWKWDQKGWNMYFLIIFGNHVSAVFIPMVYCPQIIVCVFACCHLGAFIGMMINNVFVSEKKLGQGGRSKVNRVFWSDVHCKPNATSGWLAWNPNSFTMILLLLIFAYTIINSV